MLITELKIKNFKYFADLILPLSRGINIIYGINGVGKTAILEALCVAAGSFFMKLAEVEKRDIVF